MLFLEKQITNSSSGEEFTHDPFLDYGKPELGEN